MTGQVDNDRLILEAWADDCESHGEVLRLRSLGRSFGLWLALPKNVPGSALKKLLRSRVSYPNREAQQRRKIRKSELTIVWYRIEQL